MATKAETAREEREEREEQEREEREAKQHEARGAKAESKDAAKETRQHELTRSQEWREYRKRATVLVRPYRLGEDMSQVKVEEDAKRGGHPLAGDLIARESDKQEHWLIPAPTFATLYELAGDDHLTKEIARLTDELKSLRDDNARKEAERLQADWPREQPEKERARV